jgi:redox-sensitive bicupin YhaK (pirin superfamily)
MERKEFLKKGILRTGIFTASAAGLSALANNINELKTLKSMSNIDLLGFNQLPNTNSKIMANTVLHKADSRGDANHGWLHSKHTFSFASYYNPERMNFGVLRVLNDDTVAGGMGFGKHPHDNMEIISIPLSGDLEHKDSMNNVTVIKNGDIQVMSAGTGIQHSEYNKNKDAEVKFLQIWVFPNQKNVTPRYDQITLNIADRKNKLQQILSPNANDAGVWIHQNAWFHLANFDKGISTHYDFKDKENGLYIFNLKGNLKINDQSISTRDGIGIWNTTSVEITAESDAEFLLMEVPMTT